MGARGRSNIFQHQKTSACGLAVSILFQGGPGIGSTKRIQNRFRLEGAPAVAMSRVLQLEERVLEEHWWSLKPRSRGQFLQKAAPEMGPPDGPAFSSAQIARDQNWGRLADPFLGPPCV